MTALATTLRVESLKVKRTLALWMVFIAPLIVVALQVALILSRIEYFVADTAEAAWRGYCLNMITLWSLLMLPLFITLEAALLAQLEHSEKHWKQLYAQPVPRWSHYAAKFGVLLLLTALSMVVLVTLIVLSGLALHVLQPDVLPYTWDGLPLASLLVHMGRTFLGALLIIAIHTWVANRWPSFNLAVGVGILATVPNVMVMNSDKWAPRYPWTMPFVAGSGFVQLDAYPDSAMLLVAVLGGVLLAVLTGWEFSRRDVL